MIRIGIITLLMLLSLASIPVTSPAAEPAISSIAKGNNAFAFALYRELAKDAKPGENIWFSPYSIQAALAMTYAGARGKTADEMASVLGFDASQERFHPAFAQHAKRMQTFSKDFKGAFNLANAIWVDDSLEVPKPFQSVMNAHHGAGLRTIDFGASEAARKQINDWVGENTKGKIPELLPSGVIDRDTRMVLANALYFQGDWLYPFDKRSTNQESFFRSPNESVRIPMMHRSAAVRYLETPTMQLAEFPYEKSDFAFLVLLPKGKTELSVIESKLEQLNTDIAALKQTGLAISLPRFKFETNMRLQSALRHLGIMIPFSDNADFSGIGVKVTIGDIYHAATVDLDETGTVAAAATAVGMRSTLSKIKLPPEFRVDRPALMMIRHTPTNTIVFMGCLSDPRSK